jgi:iron complex transport system ATP-binding protein
MEIARSGGIDLRNLNVSFNGTHILDGICTQFKPGECVAIVGPNGAGKSSLMRSIAGAIPYSGTISLDGRDLVEWSSHELSRLLAFLPQNSQISWPLSVREVVTLGRSPHGASLYHQSVEDRLAIDAALEDCSLTALQDRSVASLSGGELARVHVARALSTHAHVLLADEPTASLDPLHKNDVMRLLSKHAKSGAIVVFVSHDLDLAWRYASRILVLERGRRAGEGTIEDLIAANVLNRVFKMNFLMHSQDGARFLSIQDH